MLNNIKLYLLAFSWGPYLLGTCTDPDLPV